MARATNKLLFFCQGYFIGYFLTDVLACVLTQTQAHVQHVHCMADLSSQHVKDEILTCCFFKANSKDAKMSHFIPVTLKVDTL